MPGKKLVVGKAAPKVSSAAKSTTKAPQPAKKTSTLAGASKTVKRPKLTDIFVNAGFRHIPADNIHFDLQLRTGEIDHIFVWENVVLLCEETAGKDVTKHCTNKVFFHRLIAEDWPVFFAHYRVLNPQLDAYIAGKYNADELEVRHIYYSEEQAVDDGVAVNAAPFQILSQAQAAYFDSLARTIAKSAKYELLKYLNISLNRVGQARISGSGVASNSFPGFALPASHTNYPKGFAVVSFYADPVALIQRAYVLRRDGWESPDLSYQRFVRAEKLAEMRDYLAKNGKVFINNLIVTLPSKALMRDIQDQVVNPSSLAQKTHVELELPLELGTVGIVDGQHRILAYYEGEGPIDSKVEQLRKRQNLLVTGIIFPLNYTPEMRAKFEAELFLAINNTQTGVNTQLRQDLETIINPETPLAIGRSIVNRLSREGPLANLLQVSQFDPPEKVATGSLGPYVLKPLVRKGGALYKLWDPSGNKDLSDAGQRAAFVEFCFTEVRALMAGAAQNLQTKWKPAVSGGVLSTTSIGALILLRGRLIGKYGATATLDYPNLLKPLKTFKFSGYTSSQWGRMSVDMLSVV